MRKFFGAFFLGILSFISGYYLVFKTTHEALNHRDPAAIKSNFDFSNLRGEKLFSAVKQRVLNGLEFKKSSVDKAARTGISLGHFVFSNDHGEKLLGCQAFSKVSLSFEAEGVSVAGAKPLMEIEGRCEFSSDLTKINPLYLPVAKILGERPGDGEFEFNEGSKVTVRFTNLPEEWPKTWLLKSVKLLNDKTAASVLIEQDEVAKYLRHPMVLSF
ncbi:MAG: hypothetical protein ACXVCY_00770 [Pseudobdellovibrionaceae bacterium]